jgi:hypothetical protein
MPAPGELPDSVSEADPLGVDYGRGNSFGETDGNTNVRHALASPRFRIVAFADIRPVGGRNYLVKGLIPRSGIVVIYGKPKCGKSFWTTHVFAHIALGWQYRGKRVQQGACVYIACEGHAGFPIRIEAFRQRFLAESSDADVPFFYVAANLDLIADHKALIEAISLELGNMRVAAIVIDTLNRSLNGSESKDEDMGKYLRAAGVLVEKFDCAVALVHHTGIDTTRPRGHTSLTGTADVQIRVERDASDNVVATVEWMKDGPEGDQIVSRLEAVEVGTDEDGDPLTSCVVVAVDGAAVTTTKSEKSPRMTKAAATTLRALREALGDAGEPAPPSSHIPSHAKVTTLDTWREYAYRMGISAADAKPRAKQSAFKRASDYLIGSGIVGVWDPHVWIAR